MNNYLRHYANTGVFTRIAGIGDGGLKLTSFGIITLKPGETFSAAPDTCETALIVLGGICDVRGDGFAFANVGGREDVFSGKPHTVYIPCGTAYTVTGVTDVELAWTTAPADLKTPAYVIAPEQVKDVHIGKDNYQRDAFLMLTDAFPSQHLFIGEAYVPSGNHASYPPHRHDVDNLPVEVDMEEVYFFRFAPRQGYGIQKIYTDDHAIDVTCTVKHNDTTLIPRGYHPVINAPGYTMYYLWIMAGPNHRKFLSVPDPDHKWILGQ